MTLPTYGSIRSPGADSRCAVPGAPEMVRPWALTSGGGVGREGGRLALRTAVPSTVFETGRWDAGGRAAVPATAGRAAPGAGVARAGTAPVAITVRPSPTCGGCADFISAVAS